MQVEMRSSIYNVQSIAVHFGGGGHTFAAGFTIKEYKQEILDELISMCSETIKKGSK